ncbi:MAG: enoyl-CoA hydratase/isomerase family protein, partial [Chthoniobacterales bacterium]
MVELHVQDGVAWLTLKRSEARNALNSALIQGFADHLNDLRTRKDVRVIVTRGEGPSFCAGSDLRELAPLSPAEAAASEREVAKALSILDTLPQPTIAMMHGHALGGGLGLAIYHDFRIAAKDTIISMPEVALGWTPPWGIGRLMDIVGNAKTRWLLLTSSPITGAHAAE